MATEVRADVALRADSEYWDRNAHTRDLELAHRDDPAYRALQNLILRSLGGDLGLASKRILDAGCGLGYLTETLALSGHPVYGIDPSEESIAIARTRHPSVEFEAVSLQELALAPKGQFDIAIANMTLHCVADLPSFMWALDRLLAPGTGYLIATIPNPETYLQGRPDIDVSGIDLSVEQHLTIPFRIHGRQPHPSKVSYYHRPFRSYSRAFRSAGFAISDISIPQQIGPGRSRDIALLRVERFHDIAGR